MNDAYVKIIASSLIWGTVGIFARWCDYDPLTLAVLRCFFASLALFLLLARKHNFKFPRGKAILLLFLSGIFQAACMFFYFAAVNLTSLSYTLFTYYLAPVFMVIFSAIFLKEKLEKKSLVAFLFSICGLVLIIFSSPGHFKVTELQGIEFALLGSIFFSFVIIISRSLKDIGGLTLIFFQMMIAFFCLLPFWRFEFNFGAKGLAGALILGVFHTAFAYCIYYEGLREVKVQYAGVLLYLDPVAATILGYLVFQEAIHATGFLGGVLVVLAGIIIVIGSNSLPKKQG